VFHDLLAGFMQALEQHAGGMDHLLECEHGDAVIQVDVQHALAAAQVFEQIVEPRYQ